MRALGWLLVFVGALGFMVAILGNYIGLLGEFTKTNVVAIGISVLVIIVGSGIMGRATA